MSVEYVDVDSILQYVGEFSKYQIFVIFLACLMMFPTSYPNLIMYFGALNPDWRCVTNGTVCYLNGTQSKENSFRCRIPRSQWEFTKPKEYSIVTEFDLVCVTSWLMHVTTSIYFFGWIIGAIVLGWLADKYGRKKIFFPATTVLIVCVTVTAFSPNIYVFITLRFFAGFLKPGGSIVLFVIMSELVRAKYRPLAGNTLWVIYGVAICIMGVKAYFIRQWKLLFIVCSAPYIFIVFFYKCIPESLRWQRLNGKTDKAMNTLKKIAQCNNRKFPEHMYLKAEVSGHHKSSYVELFNSKRMAFYSLAQGFSWIAFGMVNYGLSFAASDLSGNLYRNHILVNSMGFLASIMAIYTLSKFGRKKSLTTSCFIASGSLIIIAILVALEKAKEIQIVFAMIGKLFVAIAFGSIYTWSLEIYPTTVRGQGMGYLQVVSRLGAASSPWVAKVLRTVHPSAPFLVMAAAGFISGVICLFLPETRNRKTNEVASDLLHGINVNIEGEKIALNDISSEHKENISSKAYNRN